MDIPSFPSALSGSAAAYLGVLLLEEAGGDAAEEAVPPALAQHHVAGQIELVLPREVLYPTLRI